MDNYQKPDKLEKVEKELYSPDSKINQKERHKIYQQQYDVPGDWVDEVNQTTQENPISLENKKGMSVFTKIFIGALGFFLIALGYALFIFGFKLGPNAEDVNIVINSPISVSAGEEFTFDLVIENNNAVSMESIDLDIEYPEGTRDGSDVSVSLPREKTDIGSIDSGSFQRETRTVFLFGEEGETKQIEAKIVYRVADSNAIFEKRKVFDVVLKSTPVRMNISSVSEVTVGQELEFDIELISNSNETLDNVLVKAEYPFGFIFKSATISPSVSNNIWRIDDLQPKDKIEFKVKGELQGQNSELKYFKFNSGLEDSQKEEEIGVLFTSVGKSVAIQKPFLEIDMAVDDDNSSVLNLDSSKTYNLDIFYKNNTNEVVKNAEIVLKIEGDVMDEQFISVPNGFYDSVSNTVTWDSSTKPEFSQLIVGEGGNLSFSFRSKKLTEAERFKNPEVSLSVKIRGQRVQENNVPENIINEVFKKIRFNSVISLDSYSLFYDGPFANKGQVPPKVEQETTYTIKFDLANSSNRISNGHLEMKLPNYVKYLGQVWPSGSNVKYNSDTKTVSIDYGEIKEGQGYNNDKLQTAFQVSIIPSITQNRTTPVLVSDIKFYGTDLFTGEQIVISKQNITTDIADSRSYYESTVSQ